MHYKAAWACGQAALRLAHMPTRRYDHHRLSPLVSTRNDEGPFVYGLDVMVRHCMLVFHGLAALHNELDAAADARARAA